jgi:hypothetical protein
LGKRGKIGFDQFDGSASFQAEMDCAVRNPRLNAASGSWVK